MVRYVVGRLFTALPVLFGVSIVSCKISSPALHRHLILPVLTSSVVATAIISRLVRSTFLEMMQQDYIKTAPLPRSISTSVSRPLWSHQKCMASYCR
jgi:ABC-type dipeptide/oligopeptide/nickel transport system permease component